MIWFVSVAAEIIAGHGGGYAYVSGSSASLELASLKSASLECARAQAICCVGAEIIADHAALTYQMKPRDLEEAAEKACKLKASEINTIFPDVSAHCQPALTCVQSELTAAEAGSSHSCIASCMRKCMICVTCCI